MSSSNGTSFAWLIFLMLLALLAGLFEAPAGAASRVKVIEAGRFLTVDSGAVALRLELAPGGGVLMDSFKARASDFNWVGKGEPAGMNVTTELINMTGLSAGSGFEHAGHSQRSAPRGGTELQINLEHKTSKLRSALIITAYPDSPVMDFRVRLINTGRDPVRNVSRYDPVSLPLPAPPKPYRAYWVTRNAYELHETEVHESLVVDGGNWNGPNAAGWIALEDRAHTAFLIVGMEWERHWAVELRAEGKGFRLSAGLRKACTQDLEPGEVLESPHVFLGIAAGDLDDAANASGDYLQRCVLPPKLRDFPYVCYDIWSTESENVESRMFAEARFAAKQLGVEVFYQDAAWYRDSDVSNKERWGLGLGSYAENRRKLPGGLRHLSDAVHGLGMRFGLWVCPEMVDVTIMEREGIPNQWMTTKNGQYNVQNIGGWNPMKMLCLGDPEVEKHLETKLLGAIDDFNLDWLKWDASGLPGLDINCDRTDHGHQSGDGSRAAVAGKYRVLDAIHKKHPNLIIEQCSYGTRLDYGVGQHGARVNWLSDSTAPSAHVRNNVMAAAYVLPSACNMTWIMRDTEVSTPQTELSLDTIFRSRMMGSFGFGTLHGSLSECVSLFPPRVIAAAIRNVRNYKTYRHLLSQHVYHLAPLGRTNEWQVLQFTARNETEAVVFLFRNGSSDTDRHVRLRELDGSRRYEIVSLNSGSKQVLPGAELSQTGVSVTLAREPQESEILLLKVHR